MFPNIVLENLPTPSSDHYPIMLVCELALNNRKGVSRFSFENVWLTDPEFSSFVTDKWKSYGEGPIVEKLDFCASDLTVGSKNNFQNLKRDIDD